jgi:hypothetical protein
VKSLEERFIELTEKYFSFLINDFSFKVTAREIQQLTSKINYQKSELALIVQYDQRDFTCFLWVVRIVEGRIPERPIFIKQNEPVNWFDFNDILNLRSPDLILTHKHFGGQITEINLETWLKHQAECLKNYAKDLLAGDTKILDQLEPIVKKRAAKLHH